MTDGSRGTAGRGGGENEVVLSGETGDAGVLKGSSASTCTGAGITRDEALASAAKDALVGPSSGYLE
jgi:hypothetical protein